MELVCVLFKMSVDSFLTILQIVGRLSLHCVQKCKGKSRNNLAPIDLGISKDKTNKVRRKAYKIIKSSN
jgi:hypothetical protein